MSIELFQHDNFGGWRFVVQPGQSIPILPPPYNRNISSIKIQIPDWVTLWESANFDEGGDQFWIQSPGDGGRCPFLFLCANAHTTLRNYRLTVSHRYSWRRSRQTSPLPIRRRLRRAEILQPLGTAQPS